MHKLGKEEADRLFQIAKNYYFSKRDGNSDYSNRKEEFESNESLFSKINQNEEKEVFIDRQSK